MNPDGSKSGDRVRWAVWVVLLLAAFLRFWHLGARSIWTDEGSTWTAAHGSLGALVHFCAVEDASPPLFYMLTSAALHLGDSEAFLRLVSALASIVMVWLTYRTVRLFASRGEAALAGLLMAVAPFQVMYAQEARTYTLVAMWMTLASFLFARIVWTGRARLWPGYAVTLAAALYTQPIGWLAIGAHGAFVLFARSARRYWRGFALALGAAILAYVPWLVVSIQQAGALPQSHWYIQSPDAKSSFLVLRTIFLSPLPLASGSLPGWPALDAWLPARLVHVGLLFLPGLPLLLAARACLPSTTRGAMLRFAAGTLILPLVAVFAASLREPLWLPRYFVFATPPLAILLAAGITSLRPAALRAGWSVILVAASIYAVALYDTGYTKEAWRDVVSYVAEHVEEDTAAGRAASAAVLVTFDDDPYRYYQRHGSRGVDLFEVSHPDVPFSSNFTAEQLDELEATARHHTAGYDEVWVVVRSANSDVRREVARRAEVVAAEGRVEIARKTFESTGGPLKVAGFRRETAGRGP